MSAIPAEDSPIPSETNADTGARPSSAEFRRVFLNVLPKPIFSALASLPHVPNERKSRRTKEAHWLHVEDAATRSLKSPRTLVEQVVQYIYRHVLPFDLPNLKGVEWWTHSRHPTGKMHFHFDRDEFLWEKDGLMRHPTVSSVLYITDAGGPTLVLEQRFGAGGVLVPKVPMSGHAYEPIENCFATFSGDLQHGVLPSGRLQQRLGDCCDDLGLDLEPDTTEDDVREGRRRITLLMNWWCSEITDEDEIFTANLSQEERWAYGAPQPKLKGWSLPNKRMREDEPMELAEEVQLLYSYGLEIDDSSSSSSSSAGSVDDF